MKREPVAARLSKHSETDPITGCRLWLATKTFGYGRIRVNGRSERAHRCAYVEKFGPIPDGLDVLHQCDTPACINPLHLYLGTDQDNANDRMNRGRTAKGERSGRAKLKDTDIPLIRDDPRSHRRIAKDYGVHHAIIGCIKRNVNWTHL